MSALRRIDLLIMVLLFFQLNPSPSLRARDQPASQSADPFLYGWSTTADLVLAMDTSQETVIAGETLGYTLTAKNLGPDHALDVALTDILPVGTGYLNSSPGCTYYLLSHRVTCELAVIPVESTTEFTITLQVDPDIQDPLMNQAVTLHVGTDPNPSDNTASLTTTVSVSADLSLDMSDFPDPVTAGMALTYTLSAQNDGSSMARDLILVDELPEGIHFVASTPGEPLCTPHLDTLTCNLGDQLPGESLFVTILASVDPAIPLVITRTNQATLTSSSPDPSSDDNFATESTLVIPDSEVPSVTWIAPVGEGVRHDVGVQIVRLEVAALDNVGIAEVRFKRWDPLLLEWIIFDTLTTEPYHLDIDTQELRYEWNEVRAEVHDWAGNIAEPRIWIYRLYTTHLPFTAR